MKRVRLLVILALIICCLLAATSCERLPTLKAPEGLKVEAATLTLSWHEVRDARLYTVSIQKEGEEAKEFPASKETYSLARLDEGSYTIKVMANGKDETSLDSRWSEPLTFIREHEPGMVFTLTDNKTAYEITAKGTATGNIVIPNTYRGLPVTSIGDRAFFNKSDVTGITFREGCNIKSIGSFAFANCSYITSVALPAGLERIGDNAFASCRLLAGELSIPGSVKEISPSAFAYCAEITSLTLGDGVRSIGKMAFTDCKKLSVITLPDSLTEIGEYAFAVCENVETVTLGDKVERIGDYAFSGCPKIASVIIPDSVTFIGEGAFFECTALAEVTLGKGVRTVSAGAFHSTKLWELNPDENEVYVGKWLIGIKDKEATTLDIRHDTVGIASFTFVNNSKLTQVRLPDSVKLIGEAAFGMSGITSFVLGSGVEEIGEQAFIGCESLSAVILGSFDSSDPDGGIEFSSLEKIGSYAFQDCKVLTSIEMPDSLKTVGSYAFKDSGLSADDKGVIYAGSWVVGFSEELSGIVTVVDGTVGIANYAFYNCEGLVGIRIPSSVRTVGRAAFYDCRALSTVTLPDTLEVIEDYTFYRCYGLKLFSLPPMLKSIGRSAFYKCGSSAAMKDNDTDSDVFMLPASVKTVGDFAFYGCVAEEQVGPDTFYYGIDTLILGDGVENIGANAFYGCNSIKTVKLGSSLKSIGEKCFYKCVSLSSVDFGSSVETVGVKAFYMCESLAEINLPASVTTLSDYAFYKCTSLTKVNLGSGIDKIGNFAFYGDWEITELYLPLSLTHVGRQAFRNCDKLTAVILHSGIQTVEKHAFYGCDNLTVYTELDSAPEGWEKYWNSSYRPVIWSCTLSEDKDYVVSIEIRENSITNKNETNSLSAPVHDGFTFIGWGGNSSATQAELTMQTLPTAENGRRLFAIWDEKSDEGGAE